MEAETAVMQLQDEQNQECQQHPKLEEARKDPPSRGRERGPADTLNSHSEPPEL